MLPQAGAILRPNKGESIGAEGREKQPHWSSRLNTSAPAGPRPPARGRDGGEVSHGLLACGGVGGITMQLPDTLEGVPDACFPGPDADDRKDALLGNPELGVHLLATDG